MVKTMGPRLGVILTASFLLPAAVIGADLTTPEQNGCRAPQIGSYLVVSLGSRNDIPIGQLQLETWNADGSLKGFRFLRQGKSYSETPYSGSWTKINGCSIKVKRDQQGLPSNVLLTDEGQPRFGIVTAPGAVVSERWFTQPEGACTPETMDGYVLSVQQGHQFKNGQWQQNAVIQRERWNNWNMAGIAVSSYAGEAEVAAYQGRFTQDNNCIGRIRQQDAKGVNYAYATIIRSDGKGYAYLQTQGDDLTVALLDRQNF